MLVEVTQKDIDNGQPEESQTCMVAKAIRRKLKKKIHVQVAHGNITIGKNIYYNDSKLEAKICAFDNNKKRVKPFSIKFNKDRSTASMVR